MKITGLNKDDVIEILPIEIERVAPDSQVNAINCSIWAKSGCFSGAGQFWAGSNLDTFCNELRELDRTLVGHSKLAWAVDNDLRFSLEIFNLDSRGHIFVRTKIVSGDRYSEENTTFSIVQLGFEIDPNCLAAIAEYLEKLLV